MRKFSDREITEIIEDKKTVFGVEKMSFSEEEQENTRRYLAGEVSDGEYFKCDKYTVKTADRQQKDGEQTELLRRIDPEEYFYSLQSVNKLEGITRYSDIVEADRYFSGKRYDMVIKNFGEEDLDLSNFCKIHESMFGDIYYFAGKFRDVNMQLDPSTRFASAKGLRSRAESIFGALKAGKYLKNLDKKTFIEKIALLMTELNVLHPFREGNGRSKRLFLSLLSEKAGWHLGWSAVNENEWLNADMCAFDSLRDYKKSDLSYLIHNLGKAVYPIG